MRSTLRARQLAQQSAGAPQGQGWLLSDNGYVGTYVRVDSATQVTIAVRASGHGDQGIAPKLSIALADSSEAFDVSTEARIYSMQRWLEPGVYFVRADFTNDTPNATRELSIDSLETTGAVLLADNSNENALAAANTFIKHYRKARAKLTITGSKPGAKLRVRLQRHAFNFGTNIPYAENKLILKELAPDSDGARFQRMILGRFNSVVLSNGGKWAYHEQRRDQVDLAYVDRFLEFAKENGLRARMHTLLWDTVQQPDWVASEDPRQPGLLTRAVLGDAKAKAELGAEIDERIEDYVAKRAQGYVELDVLNESLHRARYLRAYGIDGLAEIFNKTARAVARAQASTRLYLNEYNLFQWSTHPEQQGSDPYANWYRRHAEELVRAGGTLHGLGMQYYPDARSSAVIGSNAHSPARIMQVLQNLSGLGLGLSLTEFSVKREGASLERAATILEETMRLVFGSPLADSFLIWAIWEGAANPAPGSPLFDRDTRRTLVGERYDQLMAEWNTDVELVLNADATLEVTGFLGDYLVTSAGSSGTFTLDRQRSDYQITLSPPSEAAPTAR